MEMRINSGKCPQTENFSKRRFCPKPNCPEGTNVVVASCACTGSTVLDFWGRRACSLVFFMVFLFSYSYLIFSARVNVICLQVLFSMYSILHQKFCNHIGNNNIWLFSFFHFFLTCNVFYDLDKTVLSQFHNSSDMSLCRNAK